MKILIIDDEDDIRLAVRALLESKGYEVEEASGGKAGLALLKKNKFDLVLLDFFMPGMNGRQVLEEIRKLPKVANLQVILLTVSVFGEAGLAKLKELQVADYIQKPFDNKNLLQRIKKFIG